MKKINKQKIIADYESQYMKKDVPHFGVGDTVDVHVKIVEEGKKRIQIYTGIVIKKQGSGGRKTFTVRKISFAEGVERSFPVHSPNVEKVVVVKKGSAKRAKLYYLREKIGKKAKIEGEDIYVKKTSSVDAKPQQ
ncbi:MAG: 50S ribosomal protein L19 [Candidatus Omnitrophota bacterium]